MSKDCLVTKLKGTVDNDNLPILGYIRVEFQPSAGAVTGYLKSVEDADVIVKNATVSSLTLVANTQLSFSVTPSSASVGVVMYVPRYSLSTFHCISNLKAIDISEFAYDDNIDRLYIGGPSNNKNMELTGSIEMFRGRSLTAVRLSRCGGVTGNISVLSACYNIDNNGVIALGYTQVSGTIESLIEGLMSSDQGHEPMTSKTFSISAQETGCTLHGISVDSFGTIKVVVADGVATITYGTPEITAAVYTLSTNTWTYNE